MEIRPCTAAEILSRTALIAEYADECAINGMPLPDPSPELYERLENTGLMQCFGVYDGAVLVGFATVITNIVPHYNKVTAITESIFVAKAYRKGGAGLRLIGAVTEYARQRKAVGLLISAPIKGQLSAVLERMHYRLTNEVYFKCLQ